MIEQASKPMWAKCAKCAHCWPAVYYPMEAALFAKIIGKAICPKCGGKALVAKQSDGVLYEPEKA